MGLIRRIRGLLHGDRLASELDEELQFHLAMREDMNRRDGMPGDEARLAARRSFGSHTLVKERTREVDLLAFIESFLKDVHFAGHMLAKHTGFTVLAVLALAVGIGVNTAVFTTCHAVLQERLEAKNPGQLVNIYRVDQRGQHDQTFSYPDFEFYRDHNRVFSGLVATTGGELAMSAAEGTPMRSSAGGGALARVFGFRLPSVMHGSAEFVSVAAVSENYFAALGVNAIRGRVFLPQDVMALDAHPAILISDNFWQRHFAGDSSILGRNVELNGTTFTIIGITPHDFAGTVINVPNIWLPIRLWPLASKRTTVLHDQDNTCCALYGRLAPGVSLRQAQANMTLLARQVSALHSSRSEGSRTAAIRVTPGSRIGPVHVLRDRGMAFALVLIFGAAGLVLLIACANVCSLQLARSVARQKEIGVRLSLGASRFRVVRQLLTESALLGLIAGGISLLATWWALRLLMLGIARSLPAGWGSLALHLEPDLRVFAYVFVLSLFATVLFGLAPALQISGPNLASSLKEDSSAVALTGSSSRLRGWFMGIQATACLFLLIGAGLLIRGSIRSILVSPGYETKHVIALDVNFPPGLDYNRSKQVVEIRQLVQRISNVPGVIGVSEGLPPDGGGLRIAAVGLNGLKPALDRTARTVFYSYVAPNYFDCLSIPLLAGQTFPRQSATPGLAVILSQSAAEEFWPGENPIGKKVALDASNQFHESGRSIPQGGVYEVIAVAKDTRPITPQGGDNRKAYLPLPTDRIAGEPLLVRFDGNPKAISLYLGKQLRAVDPNLIVYASTLKDLLTSTPTFVITRLAAIFASLIGGIGLMLACVGIYGTVGYAVARRTREIGIRMALGARKGDVLLLIVLETCRPVALGLLVGVAAAAGASRLLKSLLFGLSTLDPISFVGVGSLFLLVAMLAAYLPARRAAQIDPLVALHCE